MSCMLCNPGVTFYYIFTHSLNVCRVYPFLNKQAIINLLGLSQQNIMDRRALNNRSLFLTVPENEKFKVRILANLVSCENSLQLSCCALT